MYSKILIIFKVLGFGSIAKKQTKQRHLSCKESNLLLIKRQNRDIVSEMLSDSDFFFSLTEQLSQSAMNRKEAT